MLLTITTTHQPATDLGYLLHKNPSKVHSFDLSFGEAHLFYGEATADRCTATLLLHVDPVGLVRDIEHLDPPRLAAFERVLFESARPKAVIVTTPNAEYNVKFETLPAEQFDHRKIVDYALERLRNKLEYTTVGFQLLLRSSA